MCHSAAVASVDSAQSLLLTKRVPRLRGVQVATHGKMSPNLVAVVGVGAAPAGSTPAAGAVSCPCLHMLGGASWCGALTFAKSACPMSIRRYMGTDTAPSGWASSCWSGRLRSMHQVQLVKAGTAVAGAVTAAMQWWAPRQCYKQCYSHDPSTNGWGMSPRVHAAPQTAGISVEGHKTHPWLLT